MPAGAFGLDIENLAEEIETLGRSELREVSSLLRPLLIHLIKLAADPNAHSVCHWTDEVLTFQGNAVFACEPGMRQRIDVAAIWRSAFTAATRSLALHGVAIKALPPQCPFTLDQLLAIDFESRPAVATISKIINADQ